MVFTPCHAKRSEFARQGILDATKIRKLEAIAFPQLRRSVRAIQEEYRFSTGAFYVNMRRTMIVWIDHDPQAGKT
ncbi:hypothetical protein YH62_13155 [Rhizobium sp. LC145]|nr:hypothetical protein YH62_13155 [Rhizobium sp. LC145]